jgi:hypothetical protein
MVSLIVRSVCSPGFSRPVWHGYLMPQDPDGLRPNAFRQWATRSGGTCESSPAFERRDQRWTGISPEGTVEPRGSQPGPRPECECCEDHPLHRRRGQSHDRLKLPGPNMGDPQMPRRSVLPSGGAQSSLSGLELLPSLNPGAKATGLVSDVPSGTEPPPDYRKALG